MTKGVAYHQKRRARYGNSSDTDYEKIKSMRKGGATYKEIAVALGVSISVVKNRIHENYFCSSRPLKVPDFSGWDFSKDNVA
jgi:hypothetical protein